MVVVVMFIVAVVVPLVEDGNSFARDSVRPSAAYCREPAGVGNTVDAVVTAAAEDILTEEKTCPSKVGHWGRHHIRDGERERM